MGPCRCLPFPSCGVYDTFGDRTLVDRWGRLSSDEGDWTIVSDGPTQENGVGAGYGYFRPREAGRAMTRLLPVTGPWQTASGFTLRHQFMTADTTLDPVRLTVDCQTYGGELDWGLAITNEVGQGFIYLDTDVDGASVDKVDWLPDTWYTFELRFRPGGDVEIRVWPETGSRPASPDLSCTAGTVPATELEWQLGGFDSSVAGNDPLSEPDAEFRIRNLDFDFAGKPCWGLGCPPVADTWTETDNDPPTSNHSPFNVDGFASASIAGSNLTLTVVAEHEEVDAPAPGMSGREAAEMVLSDPVDPNEFAFSAQIAASIVTDPIDSIGTPWSEHIDVAFGGLRLSFGEDGVTPYGTFGVSFRLVKDAASLVDGLFHYELTVKLSGSYRLDPGDPQQNEIDGSSGGSIHLVDIGPFTDQTFLAGRVAIDRSLTRGTLRFYYPPIGWLEYPITADLSVLADPAFGSAIDFFRTTELLTQGAGVNETTTVQSLTQIMPCSAPPSEPAANQPVRDELAGTGDGVETVFTTRYPYLGGSLEVDVAGLRVQADNTDPAAGTFTLLVAAGSGDQVRATYRAQ